MLDDDWFEVMDPVMKMLMFEHWVADQIEKNELAKNHAYLLGSFYNPEAVKQLTGEGSDQHSSTDEEFEKTWEMIQNQDKKPGKKKRRRKIKV